jgi:hypothetical protein
MDSLASDLGRKGIKQSVQGSISLSDLLFPQISDGHPHA